MTLANWHSKMKTLGRVLVLLFGGLYSIRMVRVFLNYVPSTESINPLVLSLMPRFYEQCFLIASLSFATAYAVSELRAYGKRPQHVAQVILGVIVGMTLVGANAGLSITLPNLMGRIMPSEESIARLQSRIDTTDKQHELYPQLTLIIAKEKYLLRGEITSYVAPGGGSQAYVPSNSETETRKGVVHIHEASATFKKQAFILLAVLCSGVALGFAGPVRLSAPNQAL